MSDESLSALLDGECSAAELRSLLSGGGPSAHAMKRWGRMCQVREVLAGGQPQPGAEAFCAGVMAALQDAPAAPHKPSVVRFARRRARRWQPLVGLAAAASIAAVAVVGARHWLDRPLDAAHTVAKAQVMQTPAPAPANTDPDELRWAQLDDDTKGELNEFVLEHTSLRAGGSFNYPRMMPIGTTTNSGPSGPH